MRYRGEVMLVGTIEVEADNPQSARDKIRGLSGHELIDLGSNVDIDDRTVLRGRFFGRHGINHVEKADQVTRYPIRPPVIPERKS